MVGRNLRARLQGLVLGQINMYQALSDDSLFVVAGNRFRCRAVLELYLVQGLVDLEPLSRATWGPNLINMLVGRSLYGLT